jgi:hypothetical protein
VIEAGFDNKKNKKINEILKIHVPKFQGHVCSEVGKTPQARALGTPN